jgi:hypothetical protein
VTRTGAVLSDALYSAPCPLDWTMNTTCHMIFAVATCVVYVYTIYHAENSACFIHTVIQWW